MLVYLCVILLQVLAVNEEGLLRAEAATSKRGYPVRYSKSFGGL